VRLLLPIFKNIIMSKKNTLLALIGGLAVGAIAGVLLAPQKGSATRKKFAKKGSDFVDDVKDKFSEIKDNIAERFESAEEEAKHYAKKGSHKIASAKS
jgi:gas vesicle protein